MKYWQLCDPRVVCMSV